MSKAVVAFDKLRQRLPWYIYFWKSPKEELRDVVKNNLRTIIFDLAYVKIFISNDVISRNVIVYNGYPRKNF